MDYLLINGGNNLQGQITINGAKNGALPMLAASLLTSDVLTLSNAPNVSDVAIMCQLIESLGGQIARDKTSKTIRILCNHINNYTADYELVSKMRASIWVLGPLLARFGKAKVSLPGGCAIGARKVDLHIAVLEAMGASISLDHGYIDANINGKLKATEFNFDLVSVGATITAIMAATLAEGISSFYNCAQEPEIVDLCRMLNSMGADIKNIGTSNIVVSGVKELSGVNYKILFDRIEAGTYMLAAAITKGKIELHGIDDFESIENILFKLTQAGVKNYSQNTSIIIDALGCDILPLNLQTQVHPGFPTDLQPQFISLLCLASGSSIVTENIYDNRFMHVPELCRMGADITVQNNSAFIRPIKSFYGAEVMSSDLRCSAALVIAALMAEGESKIQRIYHLDRGYENFDVNLKNCGAKISRHQE